MTTTDSPRRARPRRPLTARAGPRAAPPAGPPLLGRAAERGRVRASEPGGEARRLTGLAAERCGAVRLWRCRLPRASSAQGEALPCCSVVGFEIRYFSYFCFLIGDYPRAVE